MLAALVAAAGAAALLALTAPGFVHFLKDLRQVYPCPSPIGQPYEAQGCAQAIFFGWSQWAVGAMALSIGGVACAPLMLPRRRLAGVTHGGGVQRALRAARGPVALAAWAAAAWLFVFGVVLGPTLLTDTLLWSGPAYLTALAVIFVVPLIAPLATAATVVGWTRMLGSPASTRSLVANVTVAVVRGVPAWGKVALGGLVTVALPSVVFTPYLFSGTDTYGLSPVTITAVGATLTVAVVCIAAPALARSAVRVASTG